MLRIPTVKPMQMDEELTKVPLDMGNIFCLDLHLELTNGCFNWMIPNLYIGNGCFTNHLFINGCLGFQAGPTSSTSSALEKKDLKFHPNLTKDSLEEHETPSTLQKRIKYR